ncbi:galanin receptor 2b-like isoform X1 [Periplaneta americana]|uniref:galanin receptor 2b-like isoform X1 n=1 Tax=Periplaneta americana TaxID=6978 RepID=UPI0037E897AF
MGVLSIHAFVRSTQLLKLVCCFAYIFCAVTADDSEVNDKAFTNNTDAKENLLVTDLTSDINWSNETKLNASNEETDYAQGDEFRVPGLDEDFEDLMAELPPNYNDTNETIAVNVSDECFKLFSGFLSMTEENISIFTHVNDSKDIDQVNLTIDDMSNMTEIETFIINNFKHRLLFMAPYDEVDDLIIQISEACPSILLQNFFEISDKIKSLRDYILEVNIEFNIHEEFYLNFSCNLLFDMKNCSDELSHFIHQLEDIKEEHEALNYYMDIHEIAGSIIFGIGIIGNIILLTVFLKHKEMRTVPNLMILNMTVADFLTLLLNALSLSKYLITGSWVFNSELCAIETFLRDFIFYANIYSIVVMNVQRSIAIFISYSCTRYPFTKRHVVFIIISVWIISGILAIYPTLNTDISVTGCLMTDYNDSSFFTNYIIITCTFSFIIPLTAIVVSACVTTRVLKKSVQHFSGDVTGLEEVRKSRALSSNVVIALTVVFALSYGPYCTIFLILYLQLVPMKYEVTLFILTYLRYMNACLNPLAMFVSSKKFREHMKKYLLFWRCKGINKLV